MASDVGIYGFKEIVGFSCYWGGGVVYLSYEKGCDFGGGAEE